MQRFDAAYRKGNCMEVLSMSQLIERGWSRNTLTQIAHSKDSPAFKTPGGGKWLFDVKKLEKYVETKMR